GQAAVELVKRPGGPAPLDASVKMTREGGPVLDLGSTRIDLRGPAQVMPSAEVPPHVQANFQSQVQLRDQANKGDMEMKDVQQNGFCRNGFKLMDLNGDGKLYEKEMNDFLDKMHALQNRATAACASLNASDQGRGLFDLLDADKDGRLGVREMRNAVK